jgi:hypothetical protein
MKPSLDWEAGYQYHLENITLLFYDQVGNVMIDPDGYIVTNIYDIITPNDLFLFKSKKEDLMVRGKSGGYVELIWPEHDETFI